MKIDLKETNTYTREISVELLWDDISSDFEEEIKVFSKKVKMPGFRPGKIPRRILLQNYQKLIESEFVENSVNKYYFKALDERHLTPINKAEVSDVHFHFGEHFRFKATFEIEPEISLPKLKKNSLKVEKTVYISDELDVDQAVEDMARSHAEIHTVEQGSEEGDFIICDLQELDSSGVPLIGKKLETRYIKIGEGPFGGENLKKLTGLKSGDLVRLTVPVNDQGKLGEYELTVKNIERQILPTIDDSFVKLVDPEAKDISDLRSRVKIRLEAAFDRRSKEAFDRQLSDAFINLGKFDFPQSMVESYLGHMVSEIKSSGNYQSEADETKIREIYKPVAERNLKWYLLRKALIKERSFEISKEEINNDILRQKENSPADSSKIEKHFKKPSNRSSLADDIMEKKLLDYLQDFAKIKEVKINTKDIRNKAQKGAG
ncbi:MAG: trigger factor [Candidatus Neomarinimicrobiota bacterium]